MPRAAPEMDLKLQNGRGGMGTPSFLEHSRGFVESTHKQTQRAGEVEDSD